MALLNLHGQRLTLTGLQFARLGKGLQLVNGLLERTLGSLDIDLSNLLTTDTARILHGDGHIDDIACNLNLGLRESEGGIRQAEAEGIGHLHAFGIEIAITHVDILLVVGIVFVGNACAPAYHLAIGVHIHLLWIVLGRGVVGGCDGPRHGELA